MDIMAAVAGMTSWLHQMGKQYKAAQDSLDAYQGKGGWTPIPNPIVDVKGPYPVKVPTKEDMKWLDDMDRKFREGGVPTKTKTKNKKKRKLVSGEENRSAWYVGKRKRRQRDVYVVRAGKKRYRSYYKR